MKSTLDVSTSKPKMPKFFEIYDELSGLAQEIGLGKISPEDGAKLGSRSWSSIAARNASL